MWDKICGGLTNERQMALCAFCMVPADKNEGHRKCYKEATKNRKGTASVSLYIRRQMEEKRRLQSNDSTTSCYEIMRQSFSTLK